MTPPTYIYVRVYTSSKGKIITYTGITTDMKKRQEQHKQGLTRTTNRYNKAYNLSEIRYKEIEYGGDYIKEYEKTVKKLSVAGKMVLTTKWKRWSG